MIFFSLAPSAAAYSTQVCAKLDNHFSEENFINAQGAWVGFGNLWRRQTDPTIPLRGVRITVSRHHPDLTFDRFETLDSPVGSDGCLLLTTSGAYRYTFTVSTAAVVNGVEIVVYEDETSNDRAEAYTKPFNGAVYYQPTNNDPVSVKPEFSSAWASLAVAGLAMHRNNLGIDACTCGECGSLEFANTSTGASGGANGSYQRRIIVSSQRKGLIAHEIGHGVGRRRDECQRPNDAWDAPGATTCDATEDDGSSGIQDGPLAPEYQSAALKEGFADFYAAWMWNTRDPACEVCYWSGEPDDAVDIDLDGTADFDNSMFAVGPRCWRVDCEGTPQDYPSMIVESYVTAYDWLENLVDHPNSGSEQCSVSLSGVGTSLDVTRYLWDMYTDQGVSLAQLVAFYDESDPHTWTERVGPDWWDMPFQRWKETIFYDYPDLYDEHVAEKQNGMDHGPGPM